MSASSKGNAERLRKVITYPLKKSTCHISMPLLN
jgi:hypothetical protein